MALSLLLREVSDLCIGKPTIRSLPPSATVGDALLALRFPCSESFVGVWSSERSSAARRALAGRVCLVDVLCFLCAEENLGSPAAALASPVSKILAKASAPVCVVEPHASIQEALDAVIDIGVQCLAVPIRSPRKRLAGGGPPEYCWLTQEDLVRFFFSSISVFSPLPSLSVSDLGLVRPADYLAVRHRDPAISAVPFLHAALAESAAVAVISEDGSLLGEISPATLSALHDESLAPAIAALSAGELMSYIDLGGEFPADFARELRERLKEREMDGMLEILDGELLHLFTTTASGASTTSGSSSSDEEEDCTPARIPRRSRSLGSYSARMGRRSEGAIVCKPESSLVAVLVQALAHRVSYVWVVDEVFCLTGIVVFSDVLRLFSNNQPLL